MLGWLTDSSKRESKWHCVQSCATCACCSNSNFVWTIRKLSWKIDTGWCCTCCCFLPARFSQFSPLHFKCLEVISLLFCQNWKVDFHCTCTQTCCGFFHNTTTNPIGPHARHGSIWRKKRLLHSSIGLQITPFSFLVICYQKEEENIIKKKMPASTVNNMNMVHQDDKLKDQVWKPSPEGMEDLAMENVRTPVGVCPSTRIEYTPPSMSATVYGNSFRWTPVICLTDTNCPVVLSYLSTSMV